MTELTGQQAKVLWVIMERIERDRRPPTLNEIAKACGFATPAGARCHVIPLEKKLFIRRQPSRACGIKPLNAAEDWYQEMKQEGSPFQVLEGRA